MHPSTDWMTEQTAPLVQGRPPTLPVEHELPEPRKHDDRLAATLTPKQRSAFAIARRAAARALRRRLRLLRLLHHALRKMLSNQDAVQRVADDLHAMVRLSKAWVQREYRSIPWKSLLYVVAAIVYFVTPVDAIPDALLAIGFVDDVAVVGAIGRALHNDLQRFRAWEVDSFH